MAEVCIGQNMFAIIFRASYSRLETTITMPAAPGEEDDMEPLEIANTYYDAFRRTTDFSEVPIAEGLVFRGPNGALEGAATFRGVVAGLAQQLRGLDIRHQVATPDGVVTVYDFDLGLPDGAIPMAEVLVIEDGSIREIELLFDARRLAPGGEA